MAEYKYDGMRAQLHLLASGDVRVYSRNCEDRTASFPDVVALVQSLLGDDLAEREVRMSLHAMRQRTTVPSRCEGRAARARRGGSFQN